MPELDLETVLSEILEAEDAGNGLSPQEWIARYPQFAPDLTAYFADQRQFDRIATTVLRVVEQGVNATVGEPATGHGEVPHRFGAYYLLEELGRGGMGIVYRARHATLGRLVALKMIQGGAWASPVERQRFRMEAELAAQLDHQHIVPIFDVGEYDGQPYFTMKLIEGDTLSNQLDHWKRDPRMSAGLIVKLSHAVHYAHQHGLLHRDLKPSNVLLDRDGQPYLTDFGLAKKEGSQDDLTQTGAVIGTPGYMAPEQASGKSRDVTTAADVYSLGAILYAMLTGQPAFGGSTPAETLRQVVESPPEPPHKFHPHLSRELETICLKCLEKEPRYRYGSADALADDLERWIGHLPIQARRSGIWGHTVKWSRRRPAVAALVAVAALAAVTIFAGSLWYNSRLGAEIAKVTRGEQAARRHAYAAQMNLAYQAWDAGQAAKALRLLDAQVPRTDQLDLRSFDWHHLRHQTQRDLRLILDLGSGPVRGIHFSHDSQQLICGCADGLVRILDLISGKVSFWKGHKAPIRATAISPRGDCLATLDESGCLRVCDLPQGLERFVKKDRARPGFDYTSISMIAFAPDGKSLVRAYSITLVSLDVNDGREHGRFTQTGSKFNSVAFTSDRVLAIATNHEGILLVPKVAPDSVPVKLGRQNAYVLNVAVSPDGATMASSSEDGMVKLWDLKSRTEVASLNEHTGAVYALAFAPEGQLLASGSEDGTVKLRNLADGTVRNYGHTGTVYSLAFSADGKFVAAGDANGSLRLWDRQRALSPDKLVGHRGVVYSLSFSPDGATLASGGKDHSIRLWDVSSGKQLTELTGHTGFVTGLGYSPDSSILASGNTHPGDLPPQPGEERGSARLWDVALRRSLATIEAHPKATWGLAFAPDGKSFATAGYSDKTVKLWDARTRQLMATLEGHPQRIWCVAYSPDGTLLASASASDHDDEETVFIWDLATKSARHRLRARWVWSVAFSPDGKLLATGSEGGLVKLWDVATGKETIPIQGHSTAVKCVAFSPDGKIVASASVDKTIRLWDVVTGDERATLKGHDSPIYSMAFSRDGKTLASGDTGGTIRLWRAATDEQTKVMGP